MRDYAKVAPTFWTGRTGRQLRSNPEAQIVAMYLMTCPHANMIGVFHCPLIYISHETGLPLEGASKGLQSLIEAGFCSFEADIELVWVHEMARFQAGDSLKANDNRVTGIRKAFESIPQSLIRQGFHRRYREAFHLPEEVFEQRPFEAPSKPLRSQEQEQEQKQEQEQEQEQEQKSGSSSSDSTHSRDPSREKPLPPLSGPSDQVQRIGYVCRLLRAMGVACSPAQFQGNYRGLENASDDDFHLAVQTLKDRGKLRIGLGLVAAVIGDLEAARVAADPPAGSPIPSGRSKPADFDPTEFINRNRRKDGHGQADDIDGHCERLE